MRPLQLTRFVYGLSVAVALAGCLGGAQPYVSHSRDNLTVGVETVDAAVFRSRSTDIAVLYETEPCHFDYSGTIYMGQEASRHGLETGRRVALRFNFHDAGGLLSYGASYIQRTGVFIVQPGRNYSVDLIYVDEGANVIFRENGRVRELPSYEAVCSS